MRNLFNRVFGNVVSDNSWYLCVEVFWAAMYASAQSFAGAYAIRLGASNSEVSLLSSIPALTAAVILLPVGHFLQYRARPTVWILASLLVARAGTLLYVAVPWVHLGNLSPGAQFVGVFALLTIPNHFFNLGFVPFLAQALPENIRADTFAARNVLIGAVMSLSNFGFGLWLGWMAFPANYQVMFVFGFVTSAVSLYYLYRVNISEVPRRAATQAASPAVARQSSSYLKEWVDFFKASWKVKAFAQITLNTFLYGTGLWAATPLLLLHFVRNLGATDRWLGELGAVSSLATIFGYIFWRQVIRRWGEPKTLRWTIVGMGIYPVLAAIVPSLTAILFAAALNGIIAAGVNLTHLNTFLRVIPAEERHNYTALHMTLMNVGAFILPLVGIALANRVGFVPVLIGCGLMSSIGATSFWIWPVGDERRPRVGPRPSLEGTD